MSTEPSWDLYRTFAAVLREGSLSGAARSLGLTQPSVARHVDALEAAVGGELFVRSQRGLSPTDRALALRPHAEALAAASASLLRTASGEAGAVAGTVRVSASEMVGSVHLPPILAASRRANPKLAVELVLNNALDDLLLRRADIAVRMIAPTQQALIARRVGKLAIGFHAHRSYCERRGVPGSFDALRAHDLIGPDTETPAVRAFLDLLPGIGRSDFALRTDSDVAHLAMIRAGSGIGVCQIAIARHDPDLVRILPDAFEIDLPLWIVMHEDLRSDPRCRAVFDAVAEGLGRL